MNKNHNLRLSSLFLLILLGLQTCWAAAVMDFDGDGKTDPIVLRTESGRWVWYILSSRDGDMAAQFGQNLIVTTTTDMAVPADYDGDGKCDLAVWRRSITGPAQSYFFIYYSGSGTVGVVALGDWQDHPIPQDYDGDGKADPAIYRQVDGGWYVQQSRDGFRADRWAVNTAITGDYDGDGKADLAGFFPNSSTNMKFYILRSSDGVWIVANFGNRMGDVVVPGDYDGDGKTDIAVWRGNCEFGNGVWYWLRSSDNYTQYEQIKWGLGCTTDKAAQGDYDGDGKTDVAVYRRGNGIAPQSYFYIYGSTNGYTAIPWGLSTDGAIDRVF